MASAIALLVEWQEQKPNDYLGTFAHDPLLRG